MRVRTKLVRKSVLRGEAAAMVVCKRFFCVLKPFRAVSVEQNSSAARKKTKRQFPPDCKLPPMPVSISARLAGV